MKNWMAMLVMIMTAAMMTSCDDDQRLANRLDGAWFGDFGMNYTFYDRYGHEITVNSYDTYIVFYNDAISASHGWGKQVDYYKWGPYERIFNKFTWRIRDGIVYLSYPRNPDLDVEIYDFRMSYGHFIGWFGNSKDGFDLDKLREDYDWDYYKGNYCEYYYSNWTYDGRYWYERYYAPSRSAVDGQEAAVAEEEIDFVNVRNTADNKNVAVHEMKSSSTPTIIRMGNRYMNNMSEAEE